MSIFKNSRKQLDDVMAMRAAFLTAAATAQESGNPDEYRNAMAQAKALNPQIDDLREQVEEENRYAAVHAPRFGTDRQDMDEMGRAMMSGERVRLDLSKAISGIRTDSLTYSGTIVQPVGAGAEIHDGFNRQVSSIVDQVNAVSLAGLSGWEEPYAVSDMEAQGGKVTTVAGTTRTATDPTFAKAKLAPYEASVTSLVDKNIADLSPADYAAKVQEMALRALRRKVGDLIINGDGQASPDMYGIVNAKNTAGAAIFNSISGITKIDENTLDELVFSYGGDEEVGGNARLILSKASLKALGALRGTNEKKRLYTITPDAGSANTGIITDGGMIVPYTISSKTPADTLLYGDPFNYMLGLFGDYIIQVDTSVKSVERMIAVLGDVKVGGNLVVDKGFCVAKIAGE